jgi:hypothetical protein
MNVLTQGTVLVQSPRGTRRMLRSNESVVSIPTLSP